MNSIFNIEAPNNPKLITGTKLPAILGRDKWKTDFEVWSDITRTYKRPFEGNKYTNAGEKIEPLIQQYLQDVYGFNLILPEQLYGKEPYKKTRGNFFEEINHPFGGMWDALVRENGEVTAVVEIKTTSRPQDWLNGSPDNYALQGALYAYLLGVEKVYMVVGFLEDKHYDDPLSFQPSGQSIHIDSFDIYTRFPDFDDMVREAEVWYDFHVLSGISPEYDLSNIKDREIVEEIMKVYVDPDEELTTLLEQAEILMTEIDEVKKQIKPKEKKLKSIKDLIKKDLRDMIGDMDKVVVTGESKQWTYSKYSKDKVDVDKLRDDGYEKYIEEVTTYQLRNKEVK